MLNDLEKLFSDAFQAQGLNSETKFAEMIDGVPHFHLGKGEYKPIANIEADISYFRINGKISFSEEAGIVPCKKNSNFVYPVKVVVIKKNADDECFFEEKITFKMFSAFGVMKLKMKSGTIDFRKTEIAKTEFDGKIAIPYDYSAVSVELTITHLFDKNCLDERCVY